MLGFGVGAFEKAIFATERVGEMPGAEGVLGNDRSGVFYAGKLLGYTAAGSSHVILDNHLWASLSRGGPRSSGG